LRKRGEIPRLSILGSQDIQQQQLILAFGNRVVEIDHILFDYSLE
jgi:hypothetical protein